MLFNTNEKTYTYIFSAEKGRKTKLLQVFLVYVE